MRPLVVGIARRGGDVFVAELYDPGADERFYRPVGGAIEFGEYSPAALRREFREELDVEIGIEECLGTTENVYTFDGTRGHEVVIVYGVALPADLYERSRLEGREDDGGTYTAVWKPVSEFEAESVPLYPEGLLALLDGDGGHAVPSS